MAAVDGDFVKQQVAAHWDRRAPGFDSGFGHSIATSAERAAWDRILGLVLPSDRTIEALDIGCGTGFLSLEMAGRGHRVTGIDFAPTMLAEARRKTADAGFGIPFEQGDAENLPFSAASFDMTITRHVLWTLPHPEAAIDDWIRVLRPGGKLVVIDSQFDPSALQGDQGARSSPEYAEIGDKLPFIGGRPQEEIETLFRAKGLVDVGGDPIRDLVDAHVQRSIAEGSPTSVRRRYVVWGHVPN
jgi:ubiquinone/menaquinone biosynthesis C-methylase UbiE